MWGNVPLAVFVPRETASLKMERLLAKLWCMNSEDRKYTLASPAGMGPAPDLIDEMLLIEAVTSGEEPYLHMQRKCSPYVYKAVLDMSDRGRQAAGLELAELFAEIPELGSAYRTLFELHGHSHIALGWSESYTLQPIHREPFVNGGTDHALTIKPAYRVTFRKLQELVPGPDGQLKIQENVYYQPVIQDLAAGDSFVVTRDDDNYTLWIFRFTVTASYDIAAHGVTQILGTLGAVGANEAKIKFVFVVPRHVLIDFTTRHTSITDDFPESVKRTELNKMGLDYPCPTYDIPSVSQLQPAAAVPARTAEAKAIELSNER